MQEPCRGQAGLQPGRWAHQAAAQETRRGLAGTGCSPAATACAVRPPPPLPSPHAAQAEGGVLGAAGGRPHARQGTREFVRGGMGSMPFAPGAEPRRPARERPWSRANPACHAMPCPPCLPARLPALVLRWLHSPGALPVALAGGPASRHAADPLWASCCRPPVSLVLPRRRAGLGVGPQPWHRLCRRGGSQRGVDPGPRLGPPATDAPPGAGPGRVWALGVGRAGRRGGARGCGGLGRAAARRRGGRCCAYACARACACCRQGVSRGALQVRRAPPLPECRSLRRGAAGAAALRCPPLGRASLLQGRPASSMP